LQPARKCSFQIAQRQRSQKKERKRQQAARRDLSKAQRCHTQGAVVLGRETSRFDLNLLGCWKALMVSCACDYFVLPMLWSQELVAVAGEESSVIVRALQTGNTLKRQNQDLWGSGARSIRIVLDDRIRQETMGQIY
jgi:hypothetical protein